MLSIAKDVNAFMKFVGTNVFYPTATEFGARISTYQENPPEQSPTALPESVSDQAKSDLVINDADSRREKASSFALTA